MAKFNDNTIEEEPEECIAGQGSTIGQYQNATVHRDGLFSTIYKASFKDPSSTRQSVVALKVTNIAAMLPPHDAAREIKLLGRAVGTNIINLIDTFRAADGLVLVFPFLPLSLAENLQNIRVSEQQKQTILRDILNGIVHLHAVGIIHRDIKPANILLKSRFGPAYLADFGTAWSSDLNGDEASHKKITDVGTTSYRAPELLFGCQHYGYPIDLWAFGCVAIQVLLWSNQPFFDSGDLGSDLALINSIFRTLGTPDNESWPEATTFPDWGKIEFVRFRGSDWLELLPNVQETGRDLILRLLKFESGDRMTASEAIKHSFYQD